MDGAVVFYFSGTGNTRSCALALAEEFAPRGLPARVLSIEAPGATEALAALEPGVLPVFAYPIYGSDLPIPMRDFLRLLPLRPAAAGTKPRDSAVFCTQLAFSGDGAAVADEELLPRGFRARWTAHIPMPNNVTIRALRLDWTNNPEKLRRIREAARARLAAFARAIVGGRDHRQGRGPLSKPLGLLQRLPFRAVVERHRDRVGVTAERCTRCGLCVRLCPVGNLSLSPGGIAAAGRCVLCLRCYNFCPQLAISFYGAAPNPRKGPPYRGPVPLFDPAVLRSEDRRIGREVPSLEPQGPKAGWEDKARRIVEEDPRLLESRQHELIVWLQDMNWPGSRLIAERLRAMGTAATPAVRTVLESDDQVWMYWVLEELIRHWPREILISFKRELRKIAGGSDEEGNAEIAGEILRDKLS